MPTNAKKTTSTTIKAVEEKTVSVATENELLKKQIEELKSQMELMTKMINTAPAKTEEVKKPERQITFVNMTNGTLILRGNNFYRIEGQFNDRSFPEKEARIIVNNSRNSVEQGCAYITDNEFVKECDLDVIYQSILSDNDLKNLFNKSPQHIIEVYKNVSKGQKDIILRMIEQKKENGEYIDANILLEVGKMANRDLISSHLDE